MTIRAFTRARHNTQRCVAEKSAPAMTMTLAGILSLGMLLGGCNQAPAPAAPAPDAAATGAPAPVPGAPAAPPASAPEAMKELPPPPRQYVVPASTSLAVRISQTISARNSNVGDSFSGTLAQPVKVEGVTVLRAGTPVTGTVTAAKGQGRFKGSGALAIAVRRVGEYPVTTSAYETDVKGKGKRSAEFIGGGGGGGALIGGLAGGGKGALIGGLLGAGAGTAGAAFTGNKDVTVPAETVVSFSLTEPLTVTMEHR